MMATRAAAAVESGGAKLSEIADMLRKRGKEHVRYYYNSIDGDNFITFVLSCGEPKTFVNNISQSCNTAYNVAKKSDNSCMRKLDSGAKMLICLCCNILI